MKDLTPLLCNLSWMLPWPIWIPTGGPATLWMTSVLRLSEGALSLRHSGGAVPLASFRGSEASEESHPRGRIAQFNWIPTDGPATLWMTSVFVIANLTK